MFTGCSSWRRIIPPAPTPYFDLNPETVILYADIHYPGVPVQPRTPADRYCVFTPLLRIWGDGLTYLSSSIYFNAENVLIGKLGPATLPTLYDILNADKFFSGWKKSTSNPAGTVLKLGAQLKGKHVTEYESSGLQPHVYLRLVETIEPQLEPLTQQGVVDPRILTFLQEYANCNEYLSHP